MSAFSITCWSDDGDPEARRDAEFEAAWDALSEEEPPEEQECPACGGLPETGCSVCRMAVARPEGGERDAD